MLIFRAWATCGLLRLLSKIVLISSWVNNKLLITTYCLLIILTAVPKVKQTGGHVNLPYTAGTGVTIECEARGWPRPKITWLRDSKSIEDINHNSQYSVKTIPKKDVRVIASQLIIFSIQKEESGIYTCKATNALKVVTKNITVLVEGR